MNSFDASIREGNERASVSKIGGIVRRFAELEMAKKMISGLDKWDFIILDGSLKPMVSGEEEKIEELFSIADEKGVIVSGLAKTSRNMENGSCVASSLDKNAEGRGELPRSRRREVRPVSSRQTYPVRLMYREWLSSP